MTCFLEQCFLDRCGDRPDGERIITKWKQDKELYTSKTATTAFDFQHFSLHDETHSISILKYIELFIGKAAVAEKLSVGDLWLLLECAYFHDIGMTLTSAGRRALWRDNDEFRHL